MDFKKPWDFVFDLKDSLDFRRWDSDTKNLLGEDIFAQNVFFLALLDKIRTFFKENPDVDF